jgi:hypothetical protein
MIEDLLKEKLLLELQWEAARHTDTLHAFYLQGRIHQIEYTLDRLKKLSTPH